VADQDCALPPRLITFGRFSLDLGKRTLCKDGCPVHVRGRELAILTYMVARSGTYVSREELIKAVWGDALVSDANLRVQMAALRRLLGHGSNKHAFVTFLPGQGYIFQTETETSRAPAPASASASASALPSPVPAPVTATATAPAPAHSVVAIASRAHNIPVRIKPVIGREDALHRLINHLPLHRLVTIVGAGGIGKTTVALACAEASFDAYEDGVRLVDLAGIADPRLVPATVAMALNTSLISPDPIDDLVKYLRDRQTLIVLDNCEHLVEHIATLVEAILTRTGDVHFLTTSREPLRADSEWVFRLGPLDVPPAGDNLGARESLTYSTVKLFIERVRLADNQFELVDGDAVAVADLCRRLDGNPLAVELAAARVGLFGIQGLAAQLAESFSTLTQGRRTALPRHQTLRATLDWSYDILTQRERQLLARLAIFRGEFTLSSAYAIAGMPLDEVVNGLAELTAKSLLNANTAVHPAQYRMLFLTRDYAMEKLVASAEFDIVAYRHAKAYLALLQAAGNDLSNGVSDVWVDDVRSALTWALGDKGDFELGMDLVTASFGTALRIASLHERGMLLDLATHRMMAIGKRYPIFEMRMLIERISVLQFSDNKEAEMPRIAERAMALAAEIRHESGDLTPLLETLITQVSIYFGDGNAPEMMRHIRLIRTLPLSDEQRQATIILLERMEFQAEYFAGNLPIALTIIKKVLAYPPNMLRVRHFTIADFITPNITGRIFLSRIQWQQGFPEKATKTSDEAIELASTLNAMVQCYVLALSAIPIAIWRGQKNRASHLIARLETVATASSLAYWQSWVPFYDAVLRLQHCGEGASDDHIEVWNAAINNMQLDHIPTLTTRLSAASKGRVDAGYSAWQAAEVLRLEGEAYLEDGKPDLAGQRFDSALSLAREQTALAWELRAATSLAKLWQAQGENDKAAGLLAGILDKFTEGFADIDLFQATALLAQVRPHDL